MGCTTKICSREEEFLDNIMTNFQIKKRKNNCENECSDETKFHYVHVTMTDYTKYKKK